MGERKGRVRGGGNKKEKKKEEEGMVRKKIGNSGHHFSCDGLSICCKRASLCFVFLLLFSRY